MNGLKTIDVLPFADQRHDDHDDVDEKDFLISLFLR